MVSNIPLSAKNGRTHSESIKRPKLSRTLPEVKTPGYSVVESVLNISGPTTRRRAANLERQDVAVAELQRVAVLGDVRTLAPR